MELFASAKADQFMVHHAQRSYYRALLEAGVRIWLYPAPAVLHTKFLTVDDDVSVIGSSNMDLRSFHLDYEISLMVLGPDFVGDLQVVAQPPTMARPVRRQRHAAHLGAAVARARVSIDRSGDHHAAERMLVTEEGPASR